MKIVPAGRRSLLPVILAVIATGCTAVPPLQPANLQAPGWKVQEIQALWRPRTGAPELIGDLLVAANPDTGEHLVQFSKQGLPIVTTQVADDCWQVSSPLSPGIHLGRLPAPGRVLWFQLDALPPRHTTSPPWRLQTHLPSGGWRLVNDRTGESLEAGAPLP